GPFPNDQGQMTNDDSAHFLHRFRQRRPFLVEAFVLDLAELAIADVEFFGDDLVGLADVGHAVLRDYEVMENLLPLLQGQAFGTHRRLLLGTKKAQWTAGPVEARPVALHKSIRVAWRRRNSVPLRSRRQHEKMGQ